MTTKINSSLYLIIFICVTLFISCQDNEVNDYYNQRVNLKVDITNQDNDLASSGKAKTITQARLAGEYVGFGGLLLYRSSIPVDGYSSIMSLYAYDLACPVEKLAIQKIKYIGNGVAKCDKCGTEYDLSLNAGNVISGDAKQSLVRYKAVYVPSDHEVFQITRY